jgi:ABC-type Fe3+ transport system permease subunit
VPFGNVAQRINFSSALFAALACAMLTLVVAELIITASYLAAAKRRKKGTKKTEELGVTHLVVAGPALGAGVLMAFSRTLWSYATITEVYALNALLIVVIFFLILRWRRRIVEGRIYVSTASDAGQITRHDTFLYSAALIFGLALGVHHVTVALTLPAIAIMFFEPKA